MKKTVLATALLIALSGAAQAGMGAAGMYDRLSVQNEATPVPAARQMTLPLYHRNAVVAQVRMDGDMNVQTEDIRSWATANMNAEGLSLLAGRFVRADGTAPLSLAYDAANGVLMINPSPVLMRKKEIALRDRALAPGEVVLPPAALSGFVNLRGGQDIVTQGMGDEGRQPLRLDSDGAVNWRDWVLEGRMHYTEDAEQPLVRDDVRLVRDIPDKMVRLAAGDLSYPVTGFQSYQSMLGVSIARNFTLQPYRVTAPTGETSFTLDSPARVEVLVNGRQVQSLRLDAGAYDMSDFPVADGGNDVTLVITDATGRVERKTFSLFSDQQLLQKGLHEYTYNVGVASDRDADGITYRAENPVASFFHRYGVSDTATLGFSGQGDDTVQQATLLALVATPVGTLGGEAAVSHADNGVAPAGRLTFRRSNAQTRRDFSATTIWRARHFTTLGLAPGANTPVLETAARYSQPVWGDTSFGVGGRYRVSRGSVSDDWSYSASLSRNFGGAINAALTAEHRRDKGAGIFLTLTWTPPLSRHSVTSSVDTLAGTQDVQWNYRADRDVSSFRFNAGATRDDTGAVRGTGGVGYNGYRGEASLRHDVTTYPDGQEMESRSQILFGTALVYADGAAAVSRPVNGSFAVLSPHASLAGRRIGVNPAAISHAASSSYQAEIDGFGPAVIPDATAYMYRPLRIDTQNLPVGYDIGRDNYTLFPSYKSGTRLVVGNAENIFADGYLHMPDGSPARMQGGAIRTASGAEQEFFTNAEGRFRISRLAPGVYTLSLHRHPGLSARLTIPDSMKLGRFDAGTLVVEGEGS